MKNNQELRFILSISILKLRCNVYKHTLTNTHTQLCQLKLLLENRGSRCIKLIKDYEQPCRLDYGVDRPAYNHNTYYYNYYYYSNHTTKQPYTYYLSILNHYKNNTKTHKNNKLRIH